jgi:hypothetical protein
MQIDDKIMERGGIEMAIKFRNYTNELGFSDDFLKVRNFLLNLGLNDVSSLNYDWVRWEWVYSLPFQDKSNLFKFGIWEDEDVIVGLVCYEDSLGSVFINLHNEYYHLLAVIFEYAEKHLHSDGRLKVAIPDNVTELQRIAVNRGFKATQHKESDAYMEIDLDRLEYTLPEGYHITTMHETYDLIKYNQVLWRGFNHEGVAPETDKDIEERRLSLSSPHSDNKLKFAVVNPNGDFVSYAGFWYDPKNDYCVIEPAATDPDYRKMGLCRAAIYEGMKACYQLGAKRCVVGSSQQFYYTIGFAPYQNRTYWSNESSL